jgi:hypothetical protein
VQVGADLDSLNAKQRAGLMFMQARSQGDRKGMRKALARGMAAAVNPLQLMPMAGYGLKGALRAMGAPEGMMGQSLNNIANKMTGYWYRDPSGKLKFSQGWNTIEGFRNDIRRSAGAMHRDGGLMPAEMRAAGRIAGLTLPVALVMAVPTAGMSLIAVPAIAAVGAGVATHIMKKGGAQMIEDEQLASKLQRKGDDGKSWADKYQQNEARRGKPLRSDAEKNSADLIWTKLDPNKQKSFLDRNNGDDEAAKYAAMDHYAGKKISKDSPLSEWKEKHDEWVGANPWDGRAEKMSVEERNLSNKLWDEMSDQQKGMFGFDGTNDSDGMKAHAMQYFGQTIAPGAYAGSQFGGAEGMHQKTRDLFDPQAKDREKEMIKYQTQAEAGDKAKKELERVGDAGSPNKNELEKQVKTGETAKQQLEMMKASKEPSLSDMKRDADHHFDNNLSRKDRKKHTDQAREELGDSASNYQVDQHARAMAYDRLRGESQTQAVDELRQQADVETDPAKKQELQDPAKIQELAGQKLKSAIYGVPEKPHPHNVSGTQQRKADEAQKYQLNWGQLSKDDRLRAATAANSRVVGDVGNLTLDEMRQVEAAAKGQYQISDLDGDKQKNVAKAILGRDINDLGNLSPQDYERVEKQAKSRGLVWANLSQGERDNFAKTTLNKQEASVGELSASEMGNAQRTAAHGDLKGADQVRRQAGFKQGLEDATLLKADPVLNHIGQNVGGYSGKLQAGNKTYTIDEHGSVYSSNDPLQRGKKVRDIDETAAVLTRMSQLTDPKIEVDGKKPFNTQTERISNIGSQNANISSQEMAAIRGLIHTDPELKATFENMNLKETSGSYSELDKRDSRREFGHALRDKLNSKEHKERLSHVARKFSDDEDLADYFRQNM